MKRSKSNMGFCALLAILLSSTLLAITPYNLESNFLICGRDAHRISDIIGNHAPVAIHSDTELSNLAYSEGWAGTGAINNPYIIKNLIISSEITCIRIENTNLHFRIVRCYLFSESESNGVGVSLLNVSNAVVENTTIVNKRIGILTQNSVNCTFTKNNVRVVTESAFKIVESRSCDIIGNSVYNAKIGYELSYLSNCRLNWNNATQITSIGITLTDCVDCQVLHNIATITRAIGLSIRNSNFLDIGFNTAYLSDGAGFELNNLHSCMLFNNTSVLNDGTGFWLDGSSSCTILFNNGVQNGASGMSTQRLRNNTFSNNILCTNGVNGLELFSTLSVSMLFNNSFGWNTRDNAYDDSTASIWLGNKWSDYEGSGEYNIPGWANANDTNPSLLVDSLPPVIYGPEKSMEVKDNETLILQWHMWDCQPSSYEIFLNGSMIERRNWGDSGVHIRLDPLPKSNYIITLKAYDKNNLSTHHSVCVTVESSTTEIVNTFYLRLGIGVIVIASLSLVYCYVGSRQLRFHPRASTNAL